MKLVLDKPEGFDADIAGFIADMQGHIAWMHAITSPSKLSQRFVVKLVRIRGTVAHTKAVDRGFFATLVR